MKKFLIGCGITIAVALVLMGLLAVTFGPRFVRWWENTAGQVKNEWHRDQARSSALSSWPKPAPDAPATSVFPPQVGAAIRTTVLDDATLGALGLSVPARQASYQTANGTVEIWAFPTASDLEKDGLLAQIRAAYERSSGSKTTVSLPSRQSFSSSSIGTNHVLTPQGWVLIFRPHTAVDPFDFIDTFLRTPAQPAQ